MQASLHKVLPSTSLFYKACTEYCPVLLFVVQSWHKACPSTTLYYRACTKQFPVLLCTAYRKYFSSANISLSQFWCSDSNTIDEVQVQMTIVLCTQPRRQATWTQPLQCVWQHHVAEPNLSTHMATHHESIHTAN